MNIDEGILTAIGHTPLVQLNKIFENQSMKLFAKLEFLNPGGSSKDRPALFMIREGIKSGEIQKDTIIIESSSGNLGISLAKICNYLGLKFICVVDPKTTEQNLNILKAFNATVELVKTPDPKTGEFLPARIHKVNELRKKLKNHFWPNQYANPNNSKSHYVMTMNEIFADLKHVDYMFCAVSSCGTIRGCVDFIRDHQLKTKVVAVDSIGSVIFKESTGQRLIPGLGAGMVPALCPKESIHHIVHVSDLDCITGCRHLIQEESILAGGSSGAVIAAVNKLKPIIPRDSTCVVIFPDRGDRYLETIYSDEWVKKQYGEVNYFW
ncbi:2,3-diaminopropionate biosynthesis protein SbnA [Chengkuizengella sediminis]|uniref:2,3-diaminopropionate biosynthesis protein SbnA n=1 Tax=Chengkuizengella sediminis TaxID=1885917 RepID=UPI00138A46CF|nr:2,3-diaminopropionate biosynthesis protein SbnA [Chengkuizengella sediminis]